MTGVMAPPVLTVYCWVITSRNRVAHENRAEARMRSSTIGPNLVKIASLYLMLGLAGGLYVALSSRFGFTSAHSHATLLGWATMAISGLVYVSFPRCAESRLANVHFWLHNCGLPVLLGGLVLKGGGHDAAEPLLGLGSTIVAAALLAFTVNVMKHATPSAAAAGPEEAVGASQTPQRSTRGAAAEVVR